MFLGVAGASLQRVYKAVTDVVAGLQVNIITPTEGQEITGDVNITWEILNTVGVNILTPTEGQEITGDVNITFELN